MMKLILSGLYIAGKAIVKACSFAWSKITSFFGSNLTRSQSNLDRVTANAVHADAVHAEHDNYLEQVPKSYSGLVASPFTIASRLKNVGGEKQIAKPMQGWTDPSAKTQAQQTNLAFLQGLRYRMAGVRTNEPKETFVYLAKDASTLDPTQTTPQAKC